MRGYTTREVARLVGLPEARVRSFVRAGFLDPERVGHGAFRFNFQDLVLLRSARELSKARIAPSRIRRALGELRRQLPSDQPLSGLSISADGRRIVVRDGRSQWNPESGQTLFDFEVADLARKVAPLNERRLRETARRRQVDAETWYEMGCDLEETSPGQAAEAYRRSIELEPVFVEALVNLGRLLQEAGQVEEAELCYRRASELRPEDPVPAFNLGVALEDRGDDSGALEAYRLAISRNGQFRDAHYNIAGVYERLGEKVAAFRHIQIYRRLTS